MEGANINMRVTKTLYVSRREDWRQWLQENHSSKDEIWLVFYRKETGQANLPYNVAVEEALCFGWIDSTRKGIDDEKYVQRFTARKPASGYSQTNKERLARLASEAKLIPEVLRELQKNRPEEYQIPEDILVALKSNEAAWEFFKSTSPSYQRIRAAYVEAARDRPGEFEKRLSSLVQKSAGGKQFGYHIEDFY
jgi:uncharacterized protein YdeI (YjbR/CyaY-like superfamily)